MPQKTLFSGIQPSGNLHLGNYLGAIMQWVEMQEDYNVILCVVDYHAITVKQYPIKLNQRIIEVAKVYLASGIDPKKSVIFQQSAIREHTELAWILNCTASHIADLNKMTQFKDKSTGKNQESISVGLYDYPVLQAADILLYGTKVVPVGEDQVQHVELTRDIAKRFNHQFGEVFTIPTAKIKKETARIMGLDDPAKKMSKSASSEYNYISLIDSPEKAAKKIMKAVTDSGSEIIYDKENKPAIANLMTIYSLLGEISFKEIEKKYQGQGYGNFKKDLAEIVKNFLTDFQEKYNSISDEEVKKILKQGADRIRPIADENMKKIREKIGVMLS